MTLNQAGATSLAATGTLASSGAPINQPQSPIFVAYPSDGHRVSHPFVLLEGSVPPGATLNLNGRPMSVGADGLFIAWVPLQSGLNHLTLTGQRGSERWTSTVRVSRSASSSLRAAPFIATAPRWAEVATPDAGRGLNTVQSAWEDDAGRAVLYAREGQRALAVGQRSDLTQMRLADGRLVWASRSTLRLLPAGTPEPTAGMGQPRQTSSPDGWREWVLPVSSRTPFTLTELPSGRGLRLSMIGARPMGDLAQNGVGVMVQDATLHLDLPLNRPLHGYQAFYQAGELGDSLIVRLREAPARGPLTGRRIVLDAGHGGTELGGAGALRVPEKSLVLPITLRVADLLRAGGADVILTRQDDRTVSLYSRTLLAESRNADVLVSIHANAIPDGKDPRTVRGIGTYFAHEQSRPLAAALQGALVAAAPEVGDDGLHAGANLALVRPTSQPSVLLELGYLTDPQNLRFLMSAAGQGAYAQAIAAGLSQYFAELPE